MPRKSFAYNLDHSKISLLPSNNTRTKILPQVMAQVAFKSVYFEFDGDQHKPYMVFDGDIEAYTVMNSAQNSGSKPDDFFNKVTRVVFAPENRPAGTWRYDFNDRQIAEIANAGWYARGSDTPPEFLTSRFALIVDNIQVDMLNPDRKKGDAPILKVGPADNHMYKFDVADYELAPFIIDNVRQAQAEFDTILDTEQDHYNAQAKETAEERAKTAIQGPAALTAQQLRIRNAAMDAEKYADSIWEDIDAYRTAHSSQYRKEMNVQKARRQFEPKQDTSAQTHSKPATKATPRTASEDSAKLNNFLGQFKSASGTKPEKDTEIKSAPENNMKDVWAQFTQSTSTGTDAKAIKKRNESAVQDNRADDAAQAVQSELTEVAEAPETAVKTDGTVISANSQTADAKAIKARNEDAAAKDRKDNAAQAAQAELTDSIDESAKIMKAVTELKTDRYGAAADANKLQQAAALTEANKKKSDSEMGS